MELVVQCCVEWLHLCIISIIMSHKERTGPSSIPRGMCNIRGIYLLIYGSAYIGY